MSAVMAEPLTPEWHEQRRKGIGASEIAAVMGISPWESPFGLYWRKVNGWEFEPDAEMEWGTRLEDAIAAKYVSVHEDEVLENGGLRVGPEPWMLATPDRLIRRRCKCDDPDKLVPDGYIGSYVCLICDGWGIGPVTGALELKTGHSAHDGWGDAGTDTIPVYYRAQVQWQMLCVGVDHATVAVLIGGSDYREYRVRRDEKDIASMVEHGRRFMARLDAGDPPPIDDHTATVATLKRLHPDLEDASVEVPTDIAAGYRRAVAMKRKAKALEDKYEAMLRAQMGSAKRAITSDGRKVATRVITDVDGYTVGPHTKDYLLAPREKK